MPPFRLYQGMDDKRYGHILSTHAMELEFDTFFFYEDPYLIVLLLGVNQKLVPMTNSRLNRWLNVLAGDYGPQQVFICPVEVKDAGPFEYAIKHLGAVIEPDSTDPLSVGNYGIFLDRACQLSSLPALRFTRRPRTSYWELFQHYGPHRTLETIQSSIPVDIQGVIAMRDEARCVFTGGQTDITTVWIVPPIFGLLTCPDSDGDWDPTTFECPANVFTMRGDLAQSFYLNRFGVDVDDQYRIVVFTPEGGLLDLLPSHFTPPSQSPNEQSIDYFLRKHFRFCLNVQLCRGDITEDFPQTQIYQTSIELGIDDLAPPKDPRWKTEIGKEIRRDLYARQIPESYNVEADYISGDLSVVFEFNLFVTISFCQRRLCDSRRGTERTKITVNVGDERPYTVNRDRFRTESGEGKSGRVTIENKRRDVNPNGDDVRKRVYMDTATRGPSGFISCAAELRNRENVEPDGGGN
ncbi:hypothetical protein R3P38DRAFT_3434336 [Favolaschia claudopus]|uniref:Uncharacterized protein n=1 Tax=Favolaschia claudopus TaxID=2862362 RepID=A0AAW0CZX3_9AGAR